MTLLSGGRFFCLRIPRRPLNDILGLFETEQDGEPAVKAYVRSLITTGDLPEAIRVASPDLWSNAEKWLDGRLSQDKEQKLFLSLYKYISRSSARSTPFGLFAGCASGNISAAASSLNFNSDNFIVHSRLDMGYTVPLAHAIAANNNVFFQLIYRPNRSIYNVSGKYRFFSYDLSGKNGFYQVETFPESRLMHDILTWAEDGIEYAQLLALVLTNYPDERTAENFIQTLVQKQFLISDIYPQITGKPFFDHLLSKVKGWKGVQDIAADLEAVQAAVHSGDHHNEHHIGDLLKSYVPVVSKRFLQKDLSYSSDETLTINQEVISEITGMLTGILSLGESYHNTHLLAFRNRFNERYGDRAVPLTEVLDPVYGIGYGKDKLNLDDVAPGLKDLSLPQKKKAVSFTWKSKHEYLLEKINTAHREQQTVITLNADDIVRLSDHRHALNMPESTFVLGNLLAKDVAELDKGDFKFVVHHIGGPSGGNLMTRFCHDNHELSSSLMEYLSAEQSANSEVILAEIVHLPEPRIGNVVMRPALRNFEIPLITQSGVTKDNEIPLNDLLVSIRNNRVVLFSEKFGKEVVPRLTTAHNFTNGIAIYQFLGDLQFQGHNFFSSWDWFPFNGQSYLPRIAYKKLVLCRARWLLRSADYKKWLKANKGVDFRVFMEQQTVAFSLPDRVILKDNDHELLLNLRSALSLSIIAEQLMHKDQLLYEFLFDPEKCVFKHGDKDFVHEIIIPLTTAKTTAKKIRKSGIVPDQRSRLLHTFGLGSEWLYFKIYTDYRFADRFIADFLLPLLDQLVAEKTIEQWFFIRYKDPESHIRIRFHHSRDGQFWKTVTEQLNQVLKRAVAEGLAGKVMTDTYEREIGRYGAANISFCEQLFYHDSVAMVRLISLLHDQDKEELRILLALKNIDLLMDDFDYTLIQKYQLSATLSALFYEEHNRNSQSDRLKISLDQKYRKTRIAIDKIMSADDTLYLKEYADCFQKRSASNKPVIHQLVEKLTADDHIDFLPALISSFIHMTMNRMFFVNQRQHELVVYHYLGKYYESLIARSQYSSKIYCD